MKHSDHSPSKDVQRTKTCPPVFAALKQFVLLLLLSCGIQQVHAAWETLVDGTSFNSRTALESEWNYYYPWGQTHNGSAKMYSSQISLSGGVMKITAVTPDPNGSTYKYASGAIHLKESICITEDFPTWSFYGEFQAPNVSGTWPAFWITHAGSWTHEVDLLEFKGTTENWCNTYDGAWETTKVNIPDSMTAWHSYELVCTKANASDVTTRFYIDGVLKATHTLSGGMGKCFWLIINLQMEGSSGSSGPTGPTYYLARNVMVKRDSLVTTPPSIPGNVQGTPGNQQVAVTWSPSANVTSYSVKRATSSGGPYTTVASGLASTRYVDTGRANGTTYYYVVSAVNAAGESANSAEVSATPAAYISIGYPATASSVQSGNEISHGNDGDLATRWTASGNTYPQWWRVDLGSVRSINNALINWFGGLSRSYQYRIETSSDDVNYTTLVDQTARTATGDSFDTFSASARYVRVTVTGVSPSGGFAAFHECEIFGEAPSAAPAAPTALTATAISRSEIDLGWTASGGATSYNVKRSTTSGGPYSTVATGVTRTSYSDIGLTSGTTYYYVVAAVNSAGESAHSAEASATTLPVSQGMPATASSSERGNEPLKGNDGSLASRWTASSGTYPQWWKVDLGSAHSINQAVIHWYGGTDRSYKYRIETSNDDVNYTTVVDQTGRTATGTSTDLFSASARYVRVTVTGVSPSGGWAAFYECQISAGTASQPPAAPTGLSATAVSSSQIDLTWTASSGASSYNVKRSTTSGGPYTTIATGVTSTSYSDTGLSAGTTYYYVVSAVNSAGESANSSQASATTLSAGTAPAAPSNLTASGGKKRVSLSWTDNSNNEDGFKIERSTDGSNFTQITTVSANTTSYNNTGLTSGTTYYYRVRAYNTNGDSAYSNIASATAN